ncbi:MAG: 2-oxoacid:acceptor oxidoreductase subunit alpha [Chloroflexi bacterium]|nr:2-oxoacid:acceptor oxidoreductase subunit alpha [Chloroflexota bacterium]
MPINDMSFRIGGEAGQGVESSGTGFAKALTRAGLYTMAVPDYYSRIRGGHNFFTIRVSEKPVYAVQDGIQVLIALNAETVARHIEHLVPGGAVIIDKGIAFDMSLLAGRDIRLLQAPLAEIARAEGDEVMVNTAGLAVMAGLTEFDLEYVIGVIADGFGKKGTGIIEANHRVAAAAHAWVREHHPDFPWRIQAQAAPKRLTVNANQAFALGALMAGCKFVAGYPMTPTTPVLEYMAQHADVWGLVMKQAESEVAAINMVVGAANAGVRAMTATSGGGFDLMTEGLSLAAMMESPVVVFLGQRPGPATGLPTRSNQADLNLALYAGHGEFSRIVLSPHTIPEFYSCGIRAFNLAEKYQCPVLVLSDHLISSSYQTVEAADIDLDNLTIDRGKLLSPAQVDAMPNYKRFALTDDGVSPRAIPASSRNAVFLTTGDEHDEEGHITEDPIIASRMTEKRLAKMKAALVDMRPPFRFGPEQADLTFICWGATYGPVVEAAKELSKQGTSANVLCFVDIWPFPVALAQAALSGARPLVSVEANARGQFAHLLQAEAGIKVQQQILRYDGRGFTPDYILAHLEAV